MGFKANESLSEQIAQHLGQQIIMGDLVEGERIQELRIAKELNVSRGSVREALLILERRHLIDIFPRRGAVVSEMSPQHVRSLYEVVVMMLSMLVRKACENWRQNEVDGLVGAISRMQHYVDDHDIEAFHEAVFDLFRMAYRFASNSYIEEVLEDLQPAVRRTTYLALHTDKRELEELFSFLKGIVEAVAIRNVERATKLVEEFGQHQRNLVLESLIRMKQVELAWAQRHRR